MRRGEIIRVEKYHFHNTGEIRDKYLIVLSDEDKYLDVVFVFTTSKVSEYSHVPNTEKVHIPIGAITCLTEETIIIVDNIHRLERHVLDQYNSENFGMITESIFEEIIYKIQNHARIKPYIKKMIK
ncbi:hypothetical protein KBC86_05120 [Candidatus Gracilibacteria bacterium]|nr:hypothetical protein [Candidatus Gracilibacteria bacterium]